MRIQPVALPVVHAMVQAIKPEQGQVQQKLTVELLALELTEVKINHAVSSVLVRKYRVDIMYPITLL